MRRARRDRPPRQRAGGGPGPSARALPIAGAGSPVAFVGGVIVLCGEQTGGHVSVTEIVVPPHTAGPPLHKHDFDEAFYMLEGELIFQGDDALVIEGAGDVSFAARNVAHALANHSDAPARSLLLCTAAGFERHWARIAAEAAGIEPPQWAMRPIPEVTIVGPQIAPQNEVSPAVRRAQASRASAGSTRRHIAPQSSPHLQGPPRGRATGRLSSAAPARAPTHRSPRRERPCNPLRRRRWEAEALPERRVRDDRAVAAREELRVEAVALDRLLERPRAGAEGAARGVRVAVDEQHALRRDPDEDRRRGVGRLLGQDEDRPLRV